MSLKRHFISNVNYICNMSGCAVLNIQYNTNGMQIYLRRDFLQTRVLVSQNQSDRTYQLPNIRIV
jgi:hypothetical protein